MMRSGLFLVSFGMLVTLGGVILRPYKETTYVPEKFRVEYAADGEALLQELGCGACHGGLSGGAELIRSRAPSLDFSAVRYRPGFLFDYLENPTRVRPAIGSSRMPRYQLDERERLALTLYLGSRVAGGEGRVRYPEGLGRDPGRRARLAGEGLVDSIGCLACHTLGGEGAGTGTELSTAAFRLEPTWLAQYVALPKEYIPETPMPGFFFFHDTSSGELVPLTDDATEKVNAVSSYLLSLSQSEVRRLERAFENARRGNPDVTVEMGERLYGALNCAGCHGGGGGVGEVFPADQAGPDLALVAGRLEQSWLRDFLAEPYAVRPSGLWPGGGQRMPDFQLSDSEVQAVVEVLEQQGVSHFPAFSPARLSPFYRSKALGYIEDRYPCLGCHRLDGDGGRIGPDLSAAGERLTPSYLRAMILDPESAHPGSHMPRMLMPEDRVDLLASFLASRTGEVEDSTYVSLLTEGFPADSPDGGASLYARNCAACHGVKGEGDGFNAAWLPVSPTNHSDSASMSKRPDDTLFDGIHAGGFILGKSHRMPAYGEMLSSSEIRQLVSYMRTLCRCLEPTWARDNR